MKKLSMASALATLSGLGIAFKAVAVSLYSITDLGTRDDWEIVPRSINNKGQVVGHLSANGLKRPFLWSDGTLTDLSPLVSYYNDARSINDRGQIAGSLSTTTDYSGLLKAVLWSDNNTTNPIDLSIDTNSMAIGINNTGIVVGQFSRDGQLHAFLWSNGITTDLGTLDGGAASFAVDVNDSGAAVGWSFTRSGTIKGVLWSNGTTTNLGTLSGSGTQAWGINNKGQVIGISFSSIGVDERGFFWEKGKMTDLGTLGGHRSWAYGINNQGQVVGAADAPNRTSAFLWSNGIMTDLNNLLPENSGWKLHSAQGINDKGQIVGMGSFNGQSRTFVMTPGSDSKSVPEPTSMLGGLAFGAFVIRAKLKRKQ